MTFSILRALICLAEEIRCEKAEIKTPKHPIKSIIFFIKSRILTSARWRKLLSGACELVKLKTKLRIRAQNIQTFNFFRQVLKTLEVQVIVLINIFDVIGKNYNNIEPKDL